MTWIRILRRKNPANNNEDVGEELPFHHEQQDAVASLIVLLEETNGLSKIGIGSTVWFDSVQDGTFYDCVEEEFEKEERDPGSTKGIILKMKPRMEDNQSSIAEKIGLTPHDTDNEEVIKEERDPGNKANAQGEQQQSNTIEKLGSTFRYSSDSEKVEAEYYDRRRKNTVLRTSELDASQLTAVSNFQTDEQGNEESRRLKITRSKKYPELLESVKMKAQKIEAFFFNKGMTVALGSLFLAMNVAVASQAAYPFTEIGGFTTDYDILKVTLPIARVGGRLVTFNCAWLLMTGCKYLWTMIRTLVVPVIPIGFPIDDIMPKYDRFVALWIIVSGLIVHTIPQVVNYATGAIQIDDRSKIWTFGKGPATRQLLITGTLLTLIFTTFSLTTLPAFRKTAAGFRWFWFFHMGGIALAYPLLIIHGTWNGSPIFLLCPLAPLALYLFDVMMRGSKITKTKTLEWRSYSDRGEHITELIVECPPNFVYTPGQYAELKFQPISSHEWHPFTIASAPNNDVRIYDGKRVKVLIFFIKSAGRWTEALFNYASAFHRSNPNTTMEISIRGPHGAPTMNFFEYKHILVVGSGVGVTPLLSVWQFMVNRGRFVVREDDDLPGTLPKFLTRNQWFRSDYASIIASLPKSDSSVEIETASGFRSACSNTKGILGSLTISIGLFGFFLTGETIICVNQIFEHYAKAASMEIVFASVSLIFHTGTMIVSALTHNGDTEYFRLLKSWIEVSIALVDAVNLWLSIAVLKKDELVDQDSTRWIVGLGGVSVFLHAVRILHIFYTTLKPKTDQSHTQSEVCSIQGILSTANILECDFVSISCCSLSKKACRGCSRCSSMAPEKRPMRHHPNTPCRCRMVPSRGLPNFHRPARRRAIITRFSPAARTGNRSSTRRFARPIDRIQTAKASVCSLVEAPPSQNVCARRRTRSTPNTDLPRKIGGERPASARL
jgi:respiratory burst oxidase